MPIARHLILVAALATALSILTAPAAFAEIEVTDEASGDLCSEVVVDSDTPTGGCPLHVVGTEAIVIELFGTPVSACDTELEARIDAAGSGALYAQDLTGEDCVTAPCAGGDDADPWPMQIEEVETGVEHVMVQTCFDTPSLGEIECTFESEVTVTGHDLSVSAAEVECDESASMTVTGAWETESDPAVEFVSTIARDPILFVHGWNSSERAWDTMIGFFRADRWPADFLARWSYNTRQSNATTAAQVSAQVDALIARTGASEVDIVTHSMGGLSSRYYLKNLSGTAKVDEWVSLGGPNHGTTRARACPLQTSCQEMQPGSAFLTSLNATTETPTGANYRTWWSPCDRVIRPTNSVLLGGTAVNTQTACLGHSALRTDPTVYGQVRDFVD